MTLANEGVSVTRTTGHNITASQLAFFCQCYTATYLKRSGHTGYLNTAFFEALLASLCENMMLVTAHKEGVPIASALFFFDETGLYGRYWGSLYPVDGLHFECCYFQGIEFAIDNNLPLFNPGTQGEHKILRGFEPIYCFSQHILFHPAFHRAVGDFLQRETPAVEAYFNQARDALPFNQAFMNKRSVKKLSDMLADTTTTRNHK